MKCSWQTFLSPLKGQCQYHALIGLSQTTRSTGGFDYVRRIAKSKNFSVDLFVLKRKKDFTFIFIVFFKKTFSFYTPFSKNPEFLMGNFQKSIDIIENMCYY